MLHMEQHGMEWTMIWIGQALTIWKELEWMDIMLVKMT